MLDLLLANLDAPVLGAGTGSVANAALALTQRDIAWVTDRRAAAGWDSGRLCGAAAELDLLGGVSGALMA